MSHVHLGLWLQGWNSRWTFAVVLRGTACGYGFEPAKSYLVYASATDGALSTNLCSRTRPMAQAAEDLAVLGMGATLTVATSLMSFM